MSDTFTQGPQGYMDVDYRTPTRTPQPFNQAMVNATLALPREPSHQFGGINRPAAPYIVGDDEEEVHEEATQPASPMEAYNPFLPKPLHPPPPAPSTSIPPSNFKPQQIHGLPAELSNRNPHVLAHAPAHQHLLDRLPPGTLFQLAMMCQRNNINLDTVPSDKLQPLLGKNSKMRMVSAVLAAARGREISSMELDDDLPRNASVLKIAKELDWEAEQIIRGTGEMLGWRQERETPYGGKIQFALGLRMNETQVPQKGSKPNSLVRTASGAFDLAKDAYFEFQAPSTRGSSIFPRVFGSHRFLRVKISAKILNETSVWGTTGERRSKGREQVQRWMKRPIVIFGRVFAPLLEKDGTVFYFLEGKDRIGEEFERVVGPGADYGITSIRTIKQLLAWWVPLEHNLNQGMSKLVTRLELGFSDTLPGILIPPENVERSDDITRYVDGEKVIFTDGAGLMTPSVARALADKYPRKEGEHSRELPLAYQIRIQTAKGVLLVDPVMLTSGDINGPFCIKLYESMIKANQGHKPIRPGPVNGMHILDAACCMLNVVKPAPVSSSNGSRLSAQFITILSDCGVPNEIFLALQENSLRKELEAWTEISVIETPRGRILDRSTRLNLAQMIGKSQSLAMELKQQELGGAAKGLGYKKYNKKERWEDDDNDVADEDEEEEDTTKPFASFSSKAPSSVDVERSGHAFGHNEISGFAMKKARALRDAFIAGMEVHKSSYWTKIWHDVVESAMQSIVAKFHFTVERSASGFFQPDPTGLLNEGEVFFRPKGVMTDSITGLRIQSVTGEVVIGRHPALLPTDMRKVTAVDIPLLADFQGIIFCSVKGELPLAAICAGGDYDGDEAMIIWEPSIVQPFKNAPLHFREPPAGFKDNFDKVTTPVNLVYQECGQLSEPEYSTKIAQHLLGSVGEGDSFSIYNSFWNMSVCKFGLRGTPEGRNPTTDMAHKFNFLMDGKKAGIRIKDDVLASDKKEWTLYDDPLWRQRQKKQDSNESIPFSDGKKKVPYLNGITQILDHLLDAGDKQLNRAINDMNEILQSLRWDTPPSQSFNPAIDMDPDLAAPWRAAKERAKQDQEVRRDVDAIEQIVKLLYKKLTDINADAARNPKGLSNYSSNIREMCRNFRAYPVASDVPSFVAQCAPETANIYLHQVKASCAYVYEMETTRGGKEKGFPWIVAMRDLCMIKAMAHREWEDPTENDLIAIPRSIYDRLETHKYWRLNNS
ncbi:hypothetical protein FRC18_011525 [Serendipita sp. 400]|nr:hypothetical protein FRC18_011525 [Serendipita sp. 400]